MSKYNLLKDEGFWVYIGILALGAFSIYVVSTRPKVEKEKCYEVLPSDKELKQIEYGDSISYNESRRLNQ